MASWASVLPAKPPGEGSRARASATPPPRASLGLAGRATGRASQHLATPPASPSRAKASATPP
eukprot:2938563-Pyramimonas_sp.AAC.1